MTMVQSGTLYQKTGLKRIKVKEPNFLGKNVGAKMGKNWGSDNLKATMSSR